MTPPSTLEELAERLRALLDYPSFSTRFSDLGFSLDQQVSAMLDGTFYAEMRARQVEEKRRIEEQIEERRAEQRAAFEADVSARMRAGAVDRRTAIDRAMATMQHDASVVLPSAVEVQP